MTQVWKLAGNVDDGSVVAPGNILPTGQSLTFPRGGSGTFEITVTTNAGIPVDLSTDPAFTLTLTVRASLTPLNPPTTIALQKVVSGPWVAANPTTPRNMVSIGLAPGDTRLLNPQRYWYDIWLVFQGNRYQVAPASVIALLPSVGLV